jgi:hypothetical protein
MAAQACAEMIELYTLHDYVMIELHRWILWHVSSISQKLLQKKKNVD